MNWAPLRTHSHFSLHRAIAKPKALAKACAEYGYGAAALTDHGNLGCAVDFSTAMQDQGIKPILGCDFSLCKGDPADKTPANGRPYSHTTVLARNKAGWTSLIGAVSQAASRDFAYMGPRTTVTALAEFAAGGNLVAITGYPGSDLANAAFDDPKAAYAETSLDEVLAMQRPRRDICKAMIRVAEEYVAAFGRDNVYLATEAVDSDLYPAWGVVADLVRGLAGHMNLPVIACSNVHYVRRDRDDRDHRVLLATGMKATLNEVNTGRAWREPDYTIGCFFKGGSHFHLPRVDDDNPLPQRHEAEAAYRLASEIESYSILSQPRLPHFPCPDGLDPASYLRRMCEDGFREKVEGRSLPYPEADYRSRLEHELSVIEGAGLPSYFLIVQDVLAFGKRQGWITGPGRGSSAGCIISWLIDITTIDPLRYGLIFERFYNAGRNAPGRVSLPDIDSDVQKYKREEYYKHLQRTYGPDRVAQIATFASLQGRSALTEVMRANGVNFDVIKRITKVIPDKARITEELQEMKERGEDPSVIAYSLDVYRDELAEWVQVDDEGEIVGGQYAPYFRQAARLEGTKTHIGRHAAGILIGDVPLDQFVPTKWDESAKGNIAAMEYLPALEAMGGCKIDILAVAFLDKAEGVRDLALTGRIGRVA